MFLFVKLHKGLLYLYQAMQYFTSVLQALTWFLQGYAFVCHDGGKRVVHIGSHNDLHALQVLHRLKTL